MNITPRSSRLHIAIFGRRNVGKSTLINAIAAQEVALVSNIPGTTTDPVYKGMELQPFGPVMLIDTAGIDDEGPIGELRMKKTLSILDKTDLGILVIDPEIGVDEREKNLIKGFKERGIPRICVINKADSLYYTQSRKDSLEETLGEPLLSVSGKTGEGINTLKENLIKIAPKDWQRPTIAGDLIKKSRIAILVVAIDSEAPQGRLILPQVQTIRDIIDHDGQALVIKEDKVKETIKYLKEVPDIVITDSQIFKKVAEDVPLSIPLTSFSILFARFKGDLDILTAGAYTIDTLKPGDRVLIAEACTHHPVSDDIGRVKIPRWLNERVGGELEYTWSAGMSFPENISDYKLVVHCGGCMINRKEMLHRIQEIFKAGVPVVNYGVLIAYLHGVFPRALEPFSY